MNLPNISNRTRTLVLAFFTVATLAAGLVVATNLYHQLTPTPSEATGSNTKAGINEGTLLGGEQTVIDFVTGKGSGPNLNMSYILEMAVNADLNGAVNFIKNANTAGLVPILRLCYTGNCSFKSAADIYNYYIQIN